MGLIALIWLPLIILRDRCGRRGPPLNHHRIARGCSTWNTNHALRATETAHEENLGQVMRHHAGQPTELYLRKT